MAQATSEKDAKKYFLPYQVRWLRDKSPVKIWEKSRRIGASYVQSYEDVSDCAAKRVPSVWFSSADLSAAAEYISYCEIWAKLFNVAAKNLGLVFLDSDKDIKTYVIQFANGTKIHGLSSNPKAFRSKGGKVILDEFAWHEDADAMWSAARPVITWGFPLRILSTHNGTNCRYFKFNDAVKKGRLNWSLHSTPIQLAVEEGLLDKILGRRATEEEKEAWLQEQRDSCFDDNTWLQEYCCIPVDEASAFLTYDLITSCEYDHVLKPLDEITGDLYVGMDIGRKRDLSIIWSFEKLGRVKYTREVRVLEKAPFHVQRDALFSVLSHRKFRRAAIDATGLGMQLAEEAKLRFGQYRVEEVTFNQKVKEEIAYSMRTNFEDKTVYVPPDPDIREDLHSVRKVVTAAGNVRFDAERSEAGHADRFWACGLGLHAAGEEGMIADVRSRSTRDMSSLTSKFTEALWKAF